MAAFRYAEQNEGVYRVAGTRVSLDSLVSLFLEGRSPEAIAQAFPHVTLEQVYGALAEYLAHRPEIDAYLDGHEAAYNKARRRSHAAHRSLVDRLHAARRPPAAAS